MGTPIDTWIVLPSSMQHDVLLRTNGACSYCSMRGEVNSVYKNTTSHFNTPSIRFSLPSPYSVTRCLYFPSHSFYTMLASQLTAILALAATVLSAPAPIILREDDVLLYGNGRYQLMKRTELDELEAIRKNGTLPPMPGSLDPKLITTSGISNAIDNTTSPQPRSLRSRDDATIIIPAPDNRFLGW